LLEITNTYYLFSMNSRHHKQAIENIRCHDGDGAVMSSNASDSVPLEPPQPANWSTYRVPRQRRRKKSTNHYTSGLWSETEQYQFLTGLMLYGWGQWKEIGTIVTTRYDTTLKAIPRNQDVPSGTYDFFMCCCRYVLTDRIVKSRVMVRKLQQSITMEKIFFNH
jgi:hypothetical protein